MSTPSFDTIRKLCWHSGRPLVPVFGAGISVESGIPLMGAIGDYLRDLKCFISSSDFHKKYVPDLGSDAIGDSGRKYLTRFGWPDRHMLRQFLRKFSMDQSGGTLEPPEWWKPLNHLASHYSDLKRILTKYNPTNRPDWWSLLATLTTSDDSLKDLLFSQLVAEAQPTTSHQYAAFLAGIMNWQLIVTTNFDSLLERALYEQGMRATVYELLPNVDLPDATLVKKGPSVIKLHGGTYSLLAGSILNVPIDYKTQEHLLQFFPKNSLLLILGYRGEDLRVRRLIEAACAQSKKQLGGKDDVKTAVWVYRSQLPEDSERLKEVGVEFVQYGDSGSYLQELYTRLTSTIPVSTASFRALAHVPPCTDDEWLKTEVTTDEFRNASTVIFTRVANDCGTSTALIRNVHQLSRGHHPVWCHLERIGAVNSLIAHLQREFRRIDPDLPVFSLFRPPPTASVPTGNMFENDPRIEWILEAMRRHAYVIAIDAVGEFGNVFSDASKNRQLNTESDQEDETKKLRDLIEMLIKKSNKFGDSKLRVSYTPPSTPKDNWHLERYCKPSSNVVAFNVSEKIQIPQKTVGSGHNARPLVLNPYCSENVKDALNQLELQDRISVNCATELRKMCGNANDEVPRRTLLVDCVTQFWDAIKEPKLKILLAVACAFRRSRPLAALRPLVIAFWDRSQAKSEHQLFEIPFPANPWDAALPARDREDLDEILDLLEQARVMVPQEGGFYWIHRLVRETIWSKVNIKDSDGRTNRSVARLHDLVATYYYEHVFRRSKDHEAMVEYLYHRASSLENGSAGELFTRLNELLTVLKRERDHLLSQSQAETLIRWARHFNEVVLKKVDALVLQFGESVIGRDLLNQLKEVFCDLRAEVLRQKSDCKGRINLRIEQIRDRLKGLEDAAKDSRSTEAVHRALTGVHRAFVDATGVFLDHNMWESNPNVEVSDTDRQTLGNFFQNLNNTLKVLLESFKDQNDGHGIYRVFSVMPELLRFKVHRLIDHIIDVAATMTRLGLDNGLVHSKKLTFPRNCELLVTLRELITQIVPDQSFSMSPATRTLLLRLRIRACFRTMEAALAPITPWHKPDASDKLLEKANDAYVEGIRALREYQGFEPRDQQHYACFLNTLHARAAYYQYDHASPVPEQFLLAHQLLDSAHAAITPPQSGSEHSALAVCHLHRAECLMLDGNHCLESNGAAQTNVTSQGNIPFDPFLNNQRGNNQQETTIEKATRARTFLIRARSSLRQAQRLLAQGRPDVTWWSWLYQLQAQLEHEWLIHPFNLGRDYFTDNDFLPSDAPVSRFVSGEMSNEGSNLNLSALTQLALDQGCVSTAEVPGRAQSLIHGLRAVRYGIQCARSDNTRLQQLQCLKTQFFVWFIWTQSNFNNGNWATEDLNLWKRACEIVGLDPNFTNQDKIHTEIARVHSTSSLSNNSHELRRRILEAEKASYEEDVQHEATPSVREFGSGNSEEPQSNENIHVIAPQAEILPGS